MAHRVHLGPGSCDGHSLPARRFIAERLGAEAASAGLDIRVAAGDAADPELFAADPGRDDAAATRLWLRLAIGRMSERLDGVGDADLRGRPLIDE